MREENRNILIAEDNVELSDMLRNYLVRANHTVYQAFNGKQAVDLVKALDIDLVLLDIMMPLMDGVQVIKEIRALKNIPIIVTSAKTSEADKELLFDLGADDYVTKPFSLKEAVMRVNAQLRRYYALNTAPNAQTDDTLHFGKLSISYSRFEVGVDGTPLNLTSKEFALLKLLTSEPNRTFSKNQILDKVWGTDYIDDNTVAVTIARLREKLIKHGVNNITTVWGFGYKWQD